MDKPIHVQTSMYNRQMTDALSYRRNVFILSICQALLVSGISLVVSTSALVGYELADNKALASLPFASQLIATMLTSIPAAMLMARIGRKPSFMIATIIAMSGAALCSYAIVQHQFYLFLIGNICLGIFTGFANYYRFTVADIVDSSHKSRAISYVLAGGVIAAFIGPNIATLTRDSIENAIFAGSYASIIVLYVLSFLLLAFLKLPAASQQRSLETEHPGRKIITIIKQARFIIAVVCALLGYSTMTLLMTATPLAMHAHQHAFSSTSFVIQWHVVGMFAPSFFTGYLINRFGLFPVMLTGAMLGIACILTNLSGTTVMQFWLALFLLGLSWNFLFIGGTTLLTETYLPAEKFKTQAINDFLIFSVVGLASFTAGMMHHQYGWELINLIAIPAYIIVIACLIWLFRLEKTSKSVPEPAITIGQ